MKSLVLTLCLSGFALFSAAQNIFPTPGPGNVGIGTQSPTTYTGYSGISLDNTGNGGFIDFRKSGSLQGTIIGDNTGMNIFTNNSTSINFLPGSNGVMMTLLANGAVGLGYPTPLGRLEVSPPPNGASVASGIFHLTGTQSWGHVVTLVTNATTGDDARLLFSYRAKSKQWAIGGYTNTSSATARFSIWEDCGDGVFNSSTSGGTGGFGTERFTVLPGGKIGIGTSVPDQMLTVMGTIHAKAVTIDLNVPGPDYVFNKDYKLKTLAEVKKYIDVNKHLPEIPSAESMKKNGVDVNDINMKLLQKVEELTLYLIEKDKEAKRALQKALEQERRIKKMEKRIVSINKTLTCSAIRKPKHI